jgi:hypothetical protein
LRLVEVTDADFIVKIRTDSSKSRFISKTNSDVEKQKLWIIEYKNREKAGEEFYFIAIDEDGVEFATYRLYDKRDNSIEIGSFVSKPQYNNPINIIKVDVIIKGYVLEDLGFTKLKFEVRKENKSVVNYHKKFHPTLICEDKLNYYFVLEKEAFLANKKKFEKLF